MWYKAALNAMQWMYFDSPIFTFFSRIPTTNTSTSSPFHSYLDASFNASKWFYVEFTAIAS